MSIFRKIVNLLKNEEKKPSEIVNNSQNSKTSSCSTLNTSSSTYNPYIYSASTSALGSVSSSNGIVSSYQTFKPTNYDLWVTDGVNNYNMIDVCRQVDKLKKLTAISLTPIDELASLLLDEDQVTREYAALYYEKLKKDFLTLSCQNKESNYE